MRIQTGEGTTIPLITLIGIWSISALNALPGLAISPILGKLSAIFPHSSELDIQLLSSLPSLLIIPFIILSGKLTEKFNNIILLQIGLTIFALSGVLYLLSSHMWQLIAVSALLGIGSGMIVPLSTGLISRFFTGTQRTKQFGYSSAITNLTLVLATILTGYLAEVNWHLPFLVYLLPIASIVLSFYLKKNIAPLPPGDTLSGGSIPAPKGLKPGKYGIEFRKLFSLMGFYGLVTYLVLIITFNLPFLMKEYHFTSGNAGIMISLFFLAIMAPGLFLNKVVSKLKELTNFYCLLAVALGFILIVVAPSEWVIAPGCVLAGLGYGVLQPVIYDKTSRTATHRKITLALAFVMSMNYLAILLCPFILDSLASLFHVKSQLFPFIFNLVVTIGAAAWSYLNRTSFLCNND